MGGKMIPSVEIWLMIVVMQVECQLTTCGYHNLRTIKMQTEWVSKTTEEDRSNLLTQINESATEAESQRASFSKTFTENRDKIQNVQQFLGESVDVVSNRRQSIEGEVDFSLNGANQSKNSIEKKRKEVDFELTSLNLDVDQLEVDIKQLTLQINQLSGLSQCLEGWMSYTNSCYLFVEVAKSFSDASENCSYYGAHLVYVESEAENNFVKNVLGMKKDDYHWMGLTDAEKEGVWKLHGSNITAPFTDWNSGEPNNSGEEDCAHFLTSVSHFLWNDAQCSSKKLFICEKGFQA